MNHPLFCLRFFSEINLILENILVMTKSTEVPIPKSARLQVLIVAYQNKRVLGDTTVITL